MSSFEPIEFSPGDFKRFTDRIKQSGYVDISKECVWLTSSSKPPHNAYNLIDNDLNSYWQSDAEQPHMVTISFPSSVVLSHICIFFDYSQDTNYTPEVMTIRSALGPYLLADLTQLVVSEPHGWYVIDLKGHTELDGASGVRMRYLQMLITENHQGGKDSHLRQIRLFTRHHRGHAQDGGL
ncbi:Anaphase-promoting complex, subunit 10 (APC10) [Carpediemonas membranifera]|uniref:Anaphase-promoting complex subunit 10 n=1 Tax=Carpediemonas membranifera TaxID=201153 RepID=A0A8J6BB69_9EUKA|nr:Anaphase-promoting complex, subunit 10 (APC10) [Carpediemonas membranifera]|eukprot:KAG9396632.1 Anaphase-promoting complex, subunit 10 (APC10) [Carpediemonas membranifera]